MKNRFDVHNDEVSEVNTNTENVKSPKEIKDSVSNFFHRNARKSETEGQSDVQAEDKTKGGTTRGKKEVDKKSETPYNIVPQEQKPKAMNPDFSTKPGEYTYMETANGKSAWGVIKVGAQSERNPAAQRAAGGYERQSHDHGGHLIPHSAGGENTERNLDAQDANVNQRGVRSVERNVTTLAKDDNNTVFYGVENYHEKGRIRPDATMVTAAVRDNTTGNMDVKHESFQNASYQDQATWQAEAEKDGEVDDRQNEGMSSEDRAFADEVTDQYENMDIDDSLGSGWLYTHFSSSETSEVSTTEEDAINGENSKVADIGADTDISEVQSNFSDDEDNIGTENSKSADTGEVDSDKTESGDDVAGDDSGTDSGTTGNKSNLESSETADTGEVDSDKAESGDDVAGDDSKTDSGETGNKSDGESSEDADAGTDAENSENNV